ncbi:Lin0368 family putative glycerol transporter subunit [Tepidibacter sp. Z1-5]|uniref:Lin0368 family putative glycerol transporter subunit n=1 Tax=Tepidibacter sp. Z1-5 TaxID=3134138 RepID=UPI0030C606F2
MTIKLAIGTFVGAFIFPFMIRLVWGNLVEDFGPIGGWMAAAFIVGLCWTLNHGVGAIHQMDGGAWIDMAWAAGIGLWAAAIVADKADVGKSIPTMVCSLIGGTLGGFFLSTFL